MKWKKRRERERKLLNQNNLKQPTSLFQAMLWVEARKPETGYSRCEQGSFNLELRTDLGPSDLSDQTTYERKFHLN